MSWENVACCDDCWWGEWWAEPHVPNARGITDEGLRLPVRIVQESRELEACHFCGWTTYSGIYVRVNTDDTPAAPARVRRETE